MTTVKTINTEDVIDIRHAVLRVGLPRNEAYFTGDDIAVHFGAFDDDKLIGVCTCLPQNDGTIQMRGMAVLPEFRSFGIGGKLLEFAFVNIGEEKLFWCNARVGAVNFYKKHGMEIAGDLFEIPTAGQHYKMVRTKQKTM